MTEIENSDPRDLALARIRVALATVAPEIAEDEVVPAASIDDDLKLDLVSRWSMMRELELMTKSRLADEDIRNARTIADVMALIAAEKKPKEPQEESMDDALASLAELFGN